MVMRETLDGFQGGLQIGGRIVTNLRCADDIHNTVGHFGVGGRIAEAGGSPRLSSHHSFTPPVSRILPTMDSSFRRTASMYVGPGLGADLFGSTDFVFVLYRVIVACD